MHLIKTSSTKGKLPKLKRDALEIVEAGIRAANAGTAIRRTVRLERDKLRVGKKSYELGRFDHVYVVGAGKASGAMAQALEASLGKRITSGFVSVKYAHKRPTRIIEQAEAGHPLPDANSLRNGKRILDIVARTTANDLIICLFSGGGSALLESLPADLTLKDLEKTTDLLCLRAGATINEVNTVRKHLSLIKGGQLARCAYPATVVSLILSDVVGDPLDIIASGPTVQDPTTFKEAYRILEKFDLLAKVPGAVVDYINKGVRGSVSETPKSGVFFKNVQTLIIGSCRMAVDAALTQAKSLGYNSLILSTSIEGEAKEVAKVYAAIAKEIIERNLPIKRPACVLSGGEMTVTVKGNGKGGRNQEFILALALALRGVGGWVAASVDTDGSDGVTDAAGAIANGLTIKDRRLAESELERNNSYGVFKEKESLIFTGPTGTNVNDLRVLLIG